MLVLDSWTHESATSNRLQPASGSGALAPGDGRQLRSRTHAPLPGEASHPAIPSSSSSGQQQQQLFRFTATRASVSAELAASLQFELQLSDEQKSGADFWPTI